MKKIYESQFLEITLMEIENIMVLRWKPETANMTNTTHVSEMNQILRLVIELGGVQRMLADIRELKFVLDQEAQTYSSELFKNNASRFFAIVSSTNPGVETAIDETLEKFDEIIGSKVGMGYFKEPEAAIIWLKECKTF